MAEIGDNQILNCNKLAMEWLRKGNNSKSEKYLSQAQSLLHSKAKSKQDNYLWAITYNNFGCLHKRKGEYSLALQYLNSALKIDDKKAKEPINIAGIHLNISAILSQLEDHSESLKHATISKRILERCKDKDQNIWTSLVICHLSVGFELERISKPNQAAKIYLKGWELAQDHLGAFHNITESIKKSYCTLLKSSAKTTDRGIQRSKTPMLMLKKSDISVIDKEERNLSFVSKSKRGKVFKDNIEHRRIESLRNLDTLDLLVNEIEIGQKTETSTEGDLVGKNRVESSVETEIRFIKGRKSERGIKKETESMKRSKEYDKGRYSQNNEGYRKVKDSERQKRYLEPFSRDGELHKKHTAGVIKRKESPIPYVEDHIIKKRSETPNYFFKYNIEDRDSPKNYEKKIIKDKEDDFFSNSFDKIAQNKVSPKTNAQRVIKENRCESPIPSFPNLSKEKRSIEKFTKAKEIESHKDKVKKEIEISIDIFEEFKKETELSTRNKLKSCSPNHNNSPKANEVNLKTNREQEIHSYHSSEYEFDKFDTPSEASLQENNYEDVPKEKSLTPEIIEKKTCDKECMTDMNNYILPTEIYTQTNEMGMLTSSTQTLAINRNPFKRIAAIIIQRSWRKHKGKIDPIYWNYLQEITEAQKNAEIAINKFNLLKMELEAKRKSPTKDSLPIPKKSKLKMDDKKVQSSITLIQFQIRKWLEQKQYK